MPNRVGQRDRNGRKDDHDRRVVHERRDGGGAGGQREHADQRRAGGVARQERAGLLDHAGPLERGAEHEHRRHRDRRLVAEDCEHLLGRQHAGDQKQADAAHRHDVDAEALGHHGREHDDQQHEHEVRLDEVPGHAVMPIRVRASRRRARRAAACFRCGHPDSGLVTFLRGLSSPLVERGQAQAQATAGKPLALCRGAARLTASQHAEA